MNSTILVNLKFASKSIIAFIFAIIILTKSTEALGNGNSLDVSIQNDFRNIPKEILLLLRGNIIDSISWMDKTGMHLVLISHFSEGKALEPGYVVQISAIQIDTINNTFQVAWKLKDFDYVDADIEYINNSLEIADINNDSIFEVSFCYKLFNVEKYSKKYMLFYNKKKYAIREYGTNGSEWTNGDTIPKVDSLVFDASYVKINNEFKEYAIKRWKSCFGTEIDNKKPPPKKKK